MSFKIVAVVLSIFALLNVSMAGSQSLAGQWRYRLDPQKVGEKESWFARELPEEVSEGSGLLSLPNTLDTAGIAPNQEKPTLMRLHRATKYVGPAWYEREIEIPAAWQGKRVTLFLERVHCSSRAWLDGRPLGMQDSLAVAHEYNLGAVTPGKHRLTLCINNIDQHGIGGSWATSVGEESQVNWNGVIGRIELQATDPVFLANVQVYPDVATRQARVAVAIGNTTGQAGRGQIEWSAGGGHGAKAKGEQPVAWTLEGGKAEFIVDLGKDAQLWDEFNPVMHTLTLRLGAQERVVSFGLRQIAAKGNQLNVNGRPVFLRGTLEHCIQPLTGHPPMDVKSWREIYRTMKSYGLNFARFHSWCPPEASFAAADLEGVYLLPEAGAWCHDVGAKPERDRWIGEEAQRILTAFGNHPCFGFLTLGNEMGGDTAALDRLVAPLIQGDARRLYATHTGIFRTAPVRLEQFRMTDGYMDQSLRNIGDSASTMEDGRKAVSMAPVPLIVHELGQGMVFPNVAEIPKYSGVLKPGNLELIREGLARKGLLDQAGAFVEVTGKLSLQQYKNVIEDQLRTPGLGGFSLLSLQDFPGQGTSTIGMLDSFWDSKGLITPEAWRRFCSETVPLLRFSKRVFAATETFSATAEVAHYGPRDLSGAEPVWSVRDEHGRELKTGRFAKLDIPTGSLTALGALEFPLTNVPAPTTLTVSVALPGTPYVNSWNLHVYPPPSEVKSPADVTVLREWGPEAKAALAEGRKVLLQIHPNLYENAFSGQFRTPFWSPVFWGSANETMGALHQAKHPVFALFPTETFRDFRWQELASYGVSLLMDATPAEYRPIVQVIDNFAQNRKLGTLFEARVGQGRLLVCGFDLWGDLSKQPAAAQLRRSLYTYLASDAFAPDQTLDVATLDKVFHKLVEGNTGKLGVRVARVDSEAPGNPATNLLDGNPSSEWRSATVANAPVFPKDIVLELPRAELLKGLKLLPAWGGRVKGYAVYTREDNSSAERAKVDWIEAARGEYPRHDSSHTVLFESPRKVQCVKLVLLSGFNNSDPFAGLAEIELLPAQ